MRLIILSPYVIRLLGLPMPVVAEMGAQVTVREGRRVRWAELTGQHDRKVILRGSNGC